MPVTDCRDCEIDLPDGDEAGDGLCDGCRAARAELKQAAEEPGEESGAAAGESGEGSETAADERGGESERAQEE